MRILFTLVYLTAFLGSTHGQGYYFIGFKDKPHYANRTHSLKELFSQKSIERRVKYGVPLTETDYPPFEFYVKGLTGNVRLIGSTRWLNGCVVFADSLNQIKRIEKLNYINKIEWIGPSFLLQAETKTPEVNLDEYFSQLEEKLKRNTDTSFYGKAYRQNTLMNLEYIHEQGYLGQGVTIAVLDAGFKSLNRIKYFKHLVSQKNILDINDFVDQNDNVFNDDEHGLSVLSCMASFEPKHLVGSSPQASYLLYRTEDANHEYLLEEYYWLMAAEKADSFGADIINSSLGYTRHDDKKMGHTYKELDGATTVVTRAAEFAAQKGMLVFVSAGNEGNDPWKYIAAPADAEDVVSVGAVDSKANYVGFSSIGPTADKRLKPDIVAMGQSVSVINELGQINSGNGTSYACPIACGAAACLMQKYPQIHPLQLKNVLIWSANNATDANKFVGFGVPDIRLADFILADQQVNGIAFARVKENKVQIILKSIYSQEVAIRIFDKQGKLVYSKTTDIKKGLQALLVSLKNVHSGNLLINAEFSKTGNSTYFRITEPF